MKTFHKHFSKLMAETLLLAAATDMPLATIAATLTQLADEERALPPEVLPQDQVRHTTHTDLAEASRFAVYAWIDEQMLHAPRPDAAAWTGKSLQMKYFHTTTAGILFFDYLDAALDACGIARQDGNEQLSTAQRLHLAANCSTEESALPAFAYCLLYGFQGKYYNNQEIVQALRAASFRFLSTQEKDASTEIVPLQSKESPSKTLLHYIEPILLILLPIALTMGFSLFCAALLTGLTTDFHV